MKRVLLIDDEKALTELASAYLSLQGFEVEACNDPTKTVEILTKRPCDALVIDLMMFPIDGLTVVRKLRALPEWAGLTVFVVSAKKVSDMERKEMLSLRVHYMPKPFLPGELVDAIRGQLAGA